MAGMGKDGRATTRSKADMRKFGFRSLRLRAGCRVQLEKLPGVIFENKFLSAPLNQSNPQ